MCPSSVDDTVCSGHTNVLVCGGGKSGTTALLYAIAAGLEDQVQITFEPQAPEQIAFGHNAHTLCKVLVDRGVAERFVAILPRFDKRVFIVRDVRDVLVSRLLYRAGHQQLAYDPERLAKWLTALRRKEADAEAVSFVDLVRQAGELAAVTEYMAQTLAEVLLPMHFWPHVAAAFHLVHYEDFVAQRAAHLNEYLGFAVRSAVEVPGWVRRVTRTRSSGDWRNWFLPSDVEALRPHLRPFLDAFGYPDDWDLPHDRRVRPEHASGYVAWIAELKRSGKS